MNKKLLCVSAICSLVSLFTACELPGPSPGSDEKVVVHIQIGNGVPGRTVRPDVASQGINWKLRGGKLGDNTDTLLEFAVVADATIALEPGEWSFTIDGYKDSDHMLSGSIAEQTISLEETQTLSFEVEPVDNEGSGDISITIHLPADSGVTSVQVRKDRADYATITVSGSEIVFEKKDFPAGEYHFSFSLYKGGKLLGVVSEIVHVWADLISAKTYTLARKDLNLVYTIKYHVWDEVALNWDDTTVEDGHYQIAATATLAEPSPRTGYTFKGWYANEDFSGGVVTRIPVGSSTGDRDFYSKWIKTFADYPLADALDEIMNGQEEEYIIILKGDKTLGPQPALTAKDGKELAITLKGDGQTTISLGSNGSLLTLSADTDSSLTLILEDITLKGKDSNNAPVVKVNSGANLDLKDGSVLTGNTSNTSGGGVVVNSDGALSMSGGAISGNKASGSNGGGVYINGGTFTMTGGAISGNSTPNSGGNGDKGGGGVYVTGGGTFTMTGGEVSGNSSGHDCGGVFVYGATFEMSGGEVSGNTASFSGGVYVAGGGTFTMNNGAISGNTVTNSAGGVMVNGGTFTMNDGAISGNKGSEGGGVRVSSGTFTMAGGTISGNTVGNSGGGVLVNGSGMLTMTGGEISGNTASNGYGGGVFVSGNGVFTKASDGVIYGSDASAELKNTSGSGTGHAVYVTADQKRDSTVEEGDTLNNAQTGAAGGWVDRG
jgi:uncharacterized repeat protein (TIGR02543 family)